MSEYRVKVSVRNNLILKAIEATGTTSVAEFCRVNELPINNINALICMRVRPITTDGVFCQTAKDLMEVLGACPTDLWTSEQLTMRLKKNSTEVPMDAQTLQAALGGQATPLLIETPEELTSKGELSKAVNDILGTLTTREQKILEMRYKQDMTLEEVAEAYNVTRERVRQIEAKALRKLRDPKRADSLRPFCDSWGIDDMPSVEVEWKHDPELREVTQYEKLDRYEFDSEARTFNRVVRVIRR